VSSLRDSRIYREVQVALFEARARFGVRLVVQSTQRNHLHLICEAPSRRALARAMQGLCIRLAKALNRLLGRRGRVFVDRYHLRVLTKPLQVRRALAYVLLNQRRHAAQTGDILPASWVDPCSSAMEFDGWKERPMAAREGPPTVVPAESWLLRVGWRRHGLIALGEIPGACCEGRSLSRGTCGASGKGR
jgi:REP element-mobilizing transposase RayT